VCSICEAVFLSINQAYVEQLQEKNPKTGQILAHFRKNIEQPIAALLTLNTIAHTVGASMGGAVALQVFGDEKIALFSAILTLLILVLSEILPKTLGAQYWRELGGLVTLFLHLLVVLMKPILIPLAFLNNLMTPKKKTGATVSRSDIAILAEIGRKEGALEDQEWQVVRNVIKLSEVRVREIMTPRPDIIAIPSDSTVAEAKKVMLEEGHFRLPVYEGSVDSIIGIIVARDLFKAEIAGEQDLKNIIREPFFVPDSKAVDELIKEMRTQKIKISIVVDEFGGTAGIVSLEDLIEEIVGEIQDEHDNEPEQFKYLPDGTCKISGFVPISDVNEKLELSLPVETYDTIGGFIFGELGRIPIAGDSVNTEGGTFTVSSMKGRRVNRVIFKKD